MTITFGAVLFLLMSLLLGAVTSLFFRSYKKSSNPGIKNIFLTFLFIFFYSLTLSILSIFALSYPYALAFGYDLAIVWVFLAMYFGLGIPTFTTNDFFLKYQKLFSTLLILIGVVVLGLQIFDLRFPIISPGSVIFWNATPLAAWLTGLTVLIYTTVWAYLAYRGSTVLSDIKQRRKFYALAFNMVCIGVSALLFFPSHSELQSLISFLLIVPAYIFTIVVFLASSRQTSV